MLHKVAMSTWLTTAREKQKNHYIAQRSLAAASKHNHKGAEVAEKSILDTDFHG